VTARSPLIPPSWTKRLVLVALLACLAGMAVSRFSTLSLLVGVVVTLVAVGLDRYCWRGKQTA
jgi:hypothetical protein